MGNRLLLLAALGGLGCATSLGPISLQAGDAVLCEGACTVKISDTETTIKGSSLRWTGPMSHELGDAWEVGIENAPAIVGAVVGGTTLGPAGAVGGGALGVIIEEVLDGSSDVEVSEP